MSHFEIIHTDAGKHVALVGDNGETVMTSEVLTGHRDPSYVVDIAAAAFQSHDGRPVLLELREPTRMVDQRTITASGEET